MTDRLGELLKEEEFIFGVICRDATMTDIELMAQEGFNIVWLDLEHGPQSTEEVIRLGRTITHLGMVPLVRIPELDRTHVQRLLDGGIQVLTLPDIRNVGQAEELTRLGKYPPLGDRGVSSTSAGTDFSLGSDVEQTIREANESTHLMVMFESDEGFDSLESVLTVEAVDMITVGPADWATSLGIYDSEGKARLSEKLDTVLETAHRSGKITSVGAAATPEEARSFQEMGVRIFFVGVDIALRRAALSGAIGAQKKALGIG